MTRSCPPAPPPTPPSFSMPAGACDTHLHVLGPYDRFPLAAERAYTAPEATVAQLRTLMDTMGIERVVIAHVSACGTDLRVTLDALAEMGERARGTAILPAHTTEAEIARLHAAGMRGVRLSPAYGEGTPIDEPTLRLWAARIAPFGWHIAMWPSNADELALLRRLAPELPVPLVIDHLANHAWRPADGADQPGFHDLLALLDTGRAWVKLSGMYRASRGPYPWPELQPYGRALLQCNPERLLWASDWPHVGVWDDNMPQSGQLLDWLPAIGADAALRQRILVDNPAALYGFGKPACPPLP